MSFLRCLPLAAVPFLLLAGLPLWAGEHRPQLRPTRDVEITYQITRPGQPTITERVRWSAAGQVERVEGPNNLTSIFDRNANEVTLLDGADRTYSVLEGTPRWPMEPEPGAVLTRGVESVVAGLRCTDWSWAEDAEARIVCATPDGVLLRLVVNGKTTVEARSVSYALQPPELFEIPPDYAPAFLAPESPRLFR